MLVTFLRNHYFSSEIVRWMLTVTILDVTAESNISRKFLVNMVFFTFSIKFYYCKKGKISDLFI